MGGDAFENALSDKPISRSGWLADRIFCFGPWRRADLRAAREPLGRAAEGNDRLGLCACRLLQGSRIRESGEAKTIDAVVRQLRHTSRRLVSRSELTIETAAPLV